MNNNRFCESGYEKIGFNYLIAGSLWFLYSFSTNDELSHHTEDTYLTVSVKQVRNMYQWNYCKMLSESVSFRDSGEADTVENACVAALSYNPEKLEFQYLGISYFWYVMKRTDESMRYIASIDGDFAEVLGPFRNFEGTEYFLTKREWALAKTILQVTGGNGLEHKAETLSDAFIGTIDAPESLKRACGQLIAAIKPITNTEFS